MKNKDIGNFWFGFLVSAVAAAWLYWLWRRNREVMPGPVILGTRSAKEKAVQAEVETVKPTAVASVKIKEKTMMEAAKKDKLEVIGGIGPASARRFNDAGVFTYAQLAALSPEQIQQITSTSRWDPADWINEARRLSADA